MNLNLFIATPMYGGMAYEPYIRSLVGLSAYLTHKKVPLSFTTTTTESLIPRGRDMLTHQFLSSDATHLFFIDGDTGFQPEDVLKICAHDKDIVGALCPRKNYIFENALNQPFANTSSLIDSMLTYVGQPFVDENGDHQLIIENGLIKASRVAGGFLCIKRNALEKMVQHYKDLKYRPDTNAPYIPGLFQQYVDEEGLLLSENFSFCDRWIKIGGEIWIDPSIRLDHFGGHLFSGQNLV